MPARSRMSSNPNPDPRPPYPPAKPRLRNSMPPRMPPTTPPARTRQNPPAGDGAGDGAGRGWVDGWVLGLDGREGALPLRLGLEKLREPRLPELMPPPARPHASSGIVMARSPTATTMVPKTRSFPVACMHASSGWRASPNVETSRARSGIMEDGSPDPKTKPPPRHFPESP